MSSSTNHAKLGYYLICTLAFCMLNSIPQTCAAEPLPLELREIELKVKNTYNLTAQTAPILNKMSQIKENLTQEPVVYAENTVSTFDTLKQFVYQNYNVYWLAGGILGTGIAHRIITDPGFYECHLPIIAPCLLGVTIGCSIHYSVKNYAERQYQRQLRESRDMVKNCINN